MNQQTNRESPENEDENLAIAMAEFLGWETSRNACEATIWHAPAARHNPLYSDDKYVNIYQLVEHFFDPDSEQPNPRGFLMVWDKLDKKFAELGVRFVATELLAETSKLEQPITEWGVDCTISSCGVGIKDGVGPTRFHAFYSAVKELVNSPGGLMDAQ